MRVVTTILLAFSTLSCAPARMFDLVPRETSASSLISPRRVAIESTRSSVSASYEGTWLDHLLFEVEVVNQSDSMLVVDPRQFSLTLWTGTGNPIRERLLPIAPEDSARVRARIARESVVAPGLGDAVLGLAALGVAAVVVAAVVAGGELPELDPAPEEAAVQVEPGPDPWAVRRADANRAGERLHETLLHRIELSPGQAVRGELWFPAQPLRRAIGPRETESSDGAWSITHHPGRRDVRCAITLHAPTALGGQQIGYFVEFD